MSRRGTIAEARAAVHSSVLALAYKRLVEADVERDEALDRAEALADAAEASVEAAITAEMAS